MKKLIMGILVLVLVILVLGGCGNTSALDITTIIRVTGGCESSAIEFTGTCTVITSRGEITVYGTTEMTPMDYEVQGEKVDCTFMKGSECGYLKVALLQDGKVVYSSSTTDPYGLIWAGVDYDNVD